MCAALRCGFSRLCQNRCHYSTGYRYPFLMQTSIWFTFACFQIALTELINWTNSSFQRLPFCNLRRLRLQCRVAVTVEEYRLLKWWRRSRSSSWTFKAHVMNRTNMTAILFGIHALSQKKHQDGGATSTSPESSLKNNIAKTPPP